MRGSGKVQAYVKMLQRGFAGTNLVTEKSLLQSEGGETGAQDDDSTEVLSLS